MLLTDQFRFNVQVFRRHRVRTLLMLIAVAIGVAAVVLLTSLGEGARRYVTNEFSSLGNKLLIIFPGRNETTGKGPPIYGTSPRDLTVDDALALQKVPSLLRVAPVIVGTIVASANSRSRDLIVMGTTADFLTVRRLGVSQGSNLPETSTELAESVCVIGRKVQQELFANNRAIGEWIRLGDRRMRVIGIIEDSGQSLGVDIADLVLIPVRTAEQLFNIQTMFRILMELKDGADQQKARHQILKVIRDRHEGEEDITLVSQDSVMQAFNNILGTLTLAIGAIGAIGLLVAGVLIMNISLISVAQRRQEIGLLKAIGGSSVQVRNLFLSESLMLVSFGAVVGAGFAFLLLFVFDQLWPSFPMAPPFWAVPAAFAIALASGLLFSWLPSKKAASLDPVLALRGQA